VLLLEKIIKKILNICDGGTTAGGTGEKKVVVPRTAAQQQRYKLAKLLKNPAKPAFIPDKPAEKLPRVFNPPEFVRNIWGSSAGAGSGDFHVYRGVRRREYARQKFLKEKYAKDDLDEEFQKRLTEHKSAAVEKTDKKRAKRLKKKAKQKNKKVAVQSKAQPVQQSDDESESDEDENENMNIDNNQQCPRVDDKVGGV
jgi:uncharacterized protein YdaU (DUF1376 family)